jgi:hypothetical protein
MFILSSSRRQLPPTPSEDKNMILQPVKKTVCTDTDGSGKYSYNTCIYINLLIRGDGRLMLCA